jgi:ABC-type glycerol-3-phosphate transport system permease component
MNQAAKNPRSSLGADLVLLIALLATVAPIGLLFYNAFRYSRDIINPGRFAAPTLYNIQQLFSGSSNFPRLFTNSLIVVVFTVVLCISVGLLAAYSLSKFEWSNLVVGALLASILLIQLVPPVALAPSFYVILNNIGLYDSRIGLILVNTVFNLPFAVFLSKAYFDGVSDELRQAALVDGSTELGAFFRVMLPLAAPGVAAVAILVAILTWNEFLMALSLTSTPNAQTITVGIATYIQPYQILYGEMTAASAIASIPIILLAIVAHRYIVAGLTTGAIKG